GIVHRYVGNEVGFTIQRSEAAQQVADVHLVTGQVTTDGVRVDGKSHPISVYSPNHAFGGEKEKGSGVKDWSEVAIERPPGCVPGKFTFILSSTGPADPFALPGELEQTRDGAREAFAAIGQQHVLAIERRQS